MKSKILATAAVMTALVGLSQFAQADNSQTFTPIEDFEPEVRQAVADKIKELSKFIRIDWQTVIIGLNEKGEIVIRAKTETEMQVMGSFSCLTDTRVK